MKALFVVNDAPYGTEKAYNALRLAMALQKEQQDTRVRVFLMADAVGCALPGQTTPQGYYNVERMIRSVIGQRRRGKPLRKLHGRERPPGAGSRKRCPEGQHGRVGQVVHRLGQGLHVLRKGGSLIGLLVEDAG